MPSIWRAELRRLLVGALVLLAVGWIVGEPAWVLLAGASGYLGWHLYRLYLLQRWLESPGGGELLPGAGVWEPVARHVNHLARRSERYRQRFRKVADRFQQAAEAAPDGTVILGSHGEIEWCNEAATTLLGLRCSTDVGQPIANLVRTPAFTRYLAAGDFDEPLEMVSPADENLRLMLKVTPYGEEQRLVLARDITRLYRLEEMRRDFVANVSHELRSPLTVIVGYLETLSDDEDPPSAWRRPLEEMSHQARRMHLIVEDLLRLSRIEHDPGGAPRTRIQVADMLESIRTDALRLRPDPPRLELDAAPDLALLGEYNELYSAFSNLTFNAVQYTPADGLVRLRWYGDEHGAHLEVSDTGEGIEAHDIPRLTERFYRVDKARSRKLGGTGLGLAIVKHVLMRHDAVLRIESELREGSRFTCDFPARRTVVTTEAQAGAR